MPEPVPKTNGDSARRYYAIRGATARLRQGLSADDCQVQSMPDASPLKWHLAHTTWFFETFVLAHADPAYTPFEVGFGELFNSYYHGVGEQYPRAERGVLSRPSLAEVLAYRDHVDTAIDRLLAADPAARLRERIELGLQHEQQHQELILTDLKHALSRNPLRPAYRPGPVPAPERGAPSRWIERPGVLIETGHAGGGFAFDNERPRHRRWVDAHAIASRPVTNAQYLEFIDDGGYATPGLWLADGWAAVQRHEWSRPLYWSEDFDEIFTLRGMLPLDPDEPVCHISWYEADAFARWAGARLPREEEWENTASSWPVAGNFVERGLLHPCPRAVEDPDFFGNVWEWTASAYLPYPGYRPPEGVLGEYNGKFMCNQFVLRGGSCASPADHLRATYRNFFYPDARWQFSGVRLAKDA